MWIITRETYDLVDHKIMMYWSHYWTHIRIGKKSKKSENMYILYVIDFSTLSFKTKWNLKQWMLNYSET